jgi:hypothetical protein
MNIHTANGYTISIDQASRLGAAWIVRVHKKSFIFNRLIASDWFLDGRQAEKFANQIAEDLRSGRSDAVIQKRKPGWTLHRPAR